MTNGDAEFLPDYDELHWAVEQLSLLHRGRRPHPGNEIPPGLPTELPDDGIGARSALEQLLGGLIAGAPQLAHPGYMAHMDPPTPWVTWAATMWAASLNQNLLHPDTGPWARELERGVVDWLARAFGMDGGHLVPGSSVANLTALWAARERTGATGVLAAPTAHLSIRKSAALLGLGVREMPLDHDGRACPAHAGARSHDIVVLTAGTVAAGLVDPLARPTDCAWLHVDAAWAGALRLTDRHRDALAGIEQADSVSVSAHKWLFQPKECALVLFADAQGAHDAISFGGGYLAAPNIGVLGSHGAAALPLAATLLAWGRRGIAERIESCMGLADRLAAAVRRHEELELLRAPETGVVLWRPRGVAPEHVRSRLADAYVSLVDLDGERWLRSVAANPHADPEAVVARVLEAARPGAAVRRGSRG